MLSDFFKIVVLLAIIIAFYLQEWVTDFSSFIIISCLSLILQKGLFQIFEAILQIILQYTAKYSKKLDNCALKYIPHCKKEPKKSEIARLVQYNDEMRQACKKMICPISKNLMRQPMITNCCRESFEGSRLLSHLKLHQRCPNCLVKITLKNISRDYKLQSEIQNFAQKMMQKANELKGASEVNPIVID